MMKRTVPRLWLCGILTASVLIFIWGNSMLPGKDSGELSGFVGAILQRILPFLNMESGTAMHLLRKAAHFSEFAALGLCLTWLYGMLATGKLCALSLPLISGAAAAAID